MTKYKKFDCVKCGTSWLGYAIKPKCRSCGSKMVNQFEAIIDDEYLKDLRTKAGAKDIKTKLEKKPEILPNYEVDDDFPNILPKELIKKKDDIIKMDNEDKTEDTESLFYGSTSVENKETNENPEKVVYRCACGGDIKKGAIFCHNCGNALLIDWDEV